MSNGKNVVVMFFLLGILLSCVFPSFADNSNTQTAIQQFNNLDLKFQQFYEVSSALAVQGVKNVIAINGFNFTLYQNGKIIDSFKAPVPPFNELKAVSHVGPALFAIGYPSWSDATQRDAWKSKMMALQSSVQAAMEENKYIDWGNPAWPGKKQQLSQFMYDSLNLVYQFASNVLKKGTYTKADYQKFVDTYLHTMVTTMYLADLANTSYAYNQLLSWKKQLGRSGWSDTYVVIYGSKGRPSAELTLQTNTAALTVESVMMPAQFEQHSFIFPTAQNVQQALEILGTMLSARDLADLSFSNSASKQVSSFNKALHNSSIPLAQYNVKNILSSLIRKEKPVLPLFKLLPKGTSIKNERGYMFGPQKGN